MSPTSFFSAQGVLGFANPAASSTSTSPANSQGGCGCSDLLWMCCSSSKKSFASAWPFLDSQLLDSTCVLKRIGFMSSVFGFKTQVLHVCQLLLLSKGPFIPLQKKQPAVHDPNSAERPSGMATGEARSRPPTSGATMCDGPGQCGPANLPTTIGCALWPKNRFIYSFLEKNRVSKFATYRLRGAQPYRKPVLWSGFLSSC